MPHYSRQRGICGVESRRVTSHVGCTCADALRVHPEGDFTLIAHVPTTDLTMLSHAATMFWRGKALMAENERLDVLKNPRWRSELVNAPRAA